MTDVRAAEGSPPWVMRDVTSVVEVEGGCRLTLDCGHSTLSPLVLFPLPLEPGTARCGCWACSGRPEPILPCGAVDARELAFVLRRIWWGRCDQCRRRLVGARAFVRMLPSARPVQTMCRGCGKRLV